MSESDQLTDNEELWPARAGQRIWADEPEGDDAVWVYCIVCGDMLELMEGDEYMVYSNGMEVYITHSSCGVKLNDLRLSIAKNLDAQDHAYDPKPEQDKEQADDQ